MEENTYDIFFSYAHADARTKVQAALISKIKQAIEETVVVVEKETKIQRKARVFLDNDALNWGDAWNAEIRKNIRKCVVFIYLLSPNYLKSDYCQREKLWWAEKEIDDGRLNKGVRPIYYIRLKESEDKIVDRYIRELKICQALDQPFFETTKSAGNGSIEWEDLIGITEKIQACFDAGEAARKSFSSIHPPISRCFVGRLQELADLNGLFSGSKKIPVISGAAGSGKSELAVAYADAYAECFPQGRFLIPMENIQTWSEAMNKLVEWCKAKKKVSPKEIGLPDDFDQLPPEEKKDAVYTMLVRRAENGGVLVLLDNLTEKNLRLISENGLTDLCGTSVLPDGLNMIATTRINEAILTSYAVSAVYGIGNLTEKDAMEFFCRVSGDVFPFAKYPMEDGKLLLSDSMPNNPLSKEEIEDINRNYDLLKCLIRLLECHAWSLEIVAARIIGGQNVFNSRKFQEELNWIKKNNINEMYAALDGIQHRTTNSEKDSETVSVSTDALLQPTFDQIMFLAKSVQGEEMLGEKILTLAQIASFFPPEQIPEKTLIGIWIQEYGNNIVTYYENKCPIQGAAYDFALGLLKRHRIINGEGPLLKMHRLTRAVLQNKLQNKEEFAIACIMWNYLDYALQDDTRMDSALQICPWCGWAEYFLIGTSMQNNIEFLETVRSLAERCSDTGLYDDAETLAGDLLVYAQKNNFTEVAADTLSLLANNEAETNQYGKCFKSMTDAIALYEQLPDDSPTKKIRLTMCYMQLANWYFATGQKEESKKSQKIYMDYIKSKQGVLNSGLDLLRYNELSSSMLRTDSGAVSAYSEKKEKAYYRAIENSRKMVDSDPSAEKINLLFCMMEKYAFWFEFNSKLSEALIWYKNALEQIERIKDTGSQKYLGSKATILEYIAGTYAEIDYRNEKTTFYQEAKGICLKAREIISSLAERFPQKYTRDLAENYSSFALMEIKYRHFAEAAEEEKKAFDIYESMAKDNPYYYKNAASSALSLTSHYLAINKPNEALKSCRQSVSFFQKVLADENIVCHKGFVSLGLANVLYSLGILELNLFSHPNEAEKAFKDSLDTFQEIISKKDEMNIMKLDINACKHYVADIKQRLSYIHRLWGFYDLAMKEQLDAFTLLRELPDSEKERWERMNRLFSYLPF